MKAVVGVFVALAVLGLLASYLHAQAVQYRAAEGYMPDTIVVKRTIPDTGRICIEPVDGGIMRCRAIGDLRKWALERQAK